MAVAMEVSSRRGPPELLGSPVPKKRAWGADAQQLMQLMMNQLQQSPSETSELTLDLSISLSPEQLLQVTTHDAVTTKRKSSEPSPTPAEDQSLELSLNLPGTPRPGTSQDGSACTMEKVRSALQRSQWLHRRSRACSPLVQTSSLPSSRDPTESPSVTLSLLSPSNSECFRRDSGSKSESAATSPCSSDGFRSPSVMSFQGDDEEVQQPGDYRDSGAKTPIESPGASGSSSPVMVAVGCKSCLMYVMLSKSQPSCPKCGNTDVLLELPVPLMKKRRLTPGEASSWSWCQA